jgi:hypothetical protein
MADNDSTAPLKRCTKCGNEKPATSDFFHAYKRSPDGRRSVCRECRAADHAANREERLAQRRAHYQANRERLTANVRAYYAENAEAQRKAALDRHYRNRDRRLPQMREYREANRERLIQEQRERGRRFFHERYGVDVEFTFKHRLRSLMRATLTNGREGRRMKDILGYTAAELRAHLDRQFTKGMSWEAFGRGEIEIDHIVPVASFRISGPDCPEFKACWALSNLRPMWAEQNRAKGATVQTLL